MSFVAALALRVFHQEIIDERLCDTKVRSHQKRQGGTKVEESAHGCGSQHTKGSGASDTPPIRLRTSGGVIDEQERIRFLLRQHDRGAFAGIKVEEVLVYLVSPERSWLEPFGPRSNPIAHLAWGSAFGEFNKDLHRDNYLAVQILQHHDLTDQHKVVEG